VLDCGKTISFTKSFVYLGSLLHCGLSDDHDIDARIKRASKAFRVPRGCFFSFSLVLKRLKDQVYAGGVLAVLLCGCESWCLAAVSLNKLCLWLRVAQNKRIREMCRVAMCQTIIAPPPRACSIKPACLTCSTSWQVAQLLWAGHVARMPKSRLPKRLMLSWVQELRLSGGQKVNYGCFLALHLQNFGLPLALTEWAIIAYGCAK
jgi:hypothetical protein